MKNKGQKTVAILSMQRVVNFGSVLQAYSIRKIIEEQTGASVCFLDIDKSTALQNECSVPEMADYLTPADYPKGLMQRGKRWIIARLSQYNRHLIREFMAKELGLDDPVRRETFDAVVIGSDEVFNHANGVCLQLHGQVPQAQRVISYAASCGSARAADIRPEDLPQVQSAMAHFQAISVRDTATERYVSALCPMEVQRHLDPVLVGELCHRAHRPVRLGKYLLVYAYGQRIRTKEEIDAIRAFAKEKGLKIVAMGGSQFWCDRYIPAKPFRMLDYFHHAEYVVTDTFHGAVFSVIHQKKFVVLPRITNREKIHSLLEDLCLTDRLIKAPEQLARVLSDEIDYDAVGQILVRERARTRRYLKQQLEE